MSCMEDFEKIRVVGRGAFGICWLCKRRGDPTGQKVIVKTIQLGTSAEDELKIMSEVVMLKKMSHPLIIGYNSYFKLPLENQLAIVMQYAEGGTMDKLIQDQQGEHFPIARTLNYFTQIVIALNHMHSKSVVHRDLKTQNILLNRKKTLVKLSDFGISKELATKSVANTVIGTPNYLSPEICEGRSYNTKTDVWSLGCILYELLELRRAFDGENIPAIVMKITKANYPAMGDHVDEAVKKFVSDLLNLNENKRPNTPEILTCPLLLSNTLSIHFDIGRLTPPDTEKRKVALGGGSRLRTTAMPSMVRMMGVGGGGGVGGVGMSSGGGGMSSGGGAGGATGRYTQSTVYGDLII